MAHRLEVTSGTEIHWCGPSLDEGPLPALIYFALTGEESLDLDPFNQPVMALEGHPIRIFSWTLFFHGKGLNPRDAMGRWLEAAAGGEDLVGDFVKESRAIIDELIERQIIDPTRLAAGGISRGGFMATHLAAVDSRIGWVVGFAPLTTFFSIKGGDAYHDHPLIASYSLISKVDALVDRKLIYYIGNHDFRVGTDRCFDFIKSLTDKAYECENRSPEVEMVIYPSIGHKGHGTPPEVFAAGADWLLARIPDLS